MNASAVDVVRAYFAAWPAKDRTAAESLVADDFTFTSPLDNRLNRTTFFARCWPNSDTTASLEITRLVPDGDLVFVTYELTSAEGHRLRNTEAVSACASWWRQIHRACDSKVTTAHYSADLQDPALTTLFCGMQGARGSLEST